jgi:hypothetical protein
MARRESRTYLATRLNSSISAKLLKGLVAEGRIELPTLGL